MFPSLKGFDFGLDEGEHDVEVSCGKVSIPQRVRLRPRRGRLYCTPYSHMSFPSLKGFDFGLDTGTRRIYQPSRFRFHPSKGSTSA